MSFNYSVSDGVLSTQGTVTITVEGVNITPTANALPDQRTGEEQDYRYQIPASTFNDADAETLTLSATLGDDSALPTWLTFDPVTGTISGTTPVNSAGSIDIKVIATDPHGATASSKYTLSILPLMDISGVLLQRDITGSYYEFTPEFITKLSDPSVTNTGIDMRISMFNNLTATYQNTFGFYFVGPSREPLIGELLQINSRDDSGTESIPKIFTQATADIPSNSIGIGFFLIPDGHDLVGVPDDGTETSLGNPNNSIANGYIYGAKIGFSPNGSVYEATLNESGTLITAIGHAHGKNYIYDNGNKSDSADDHQLNFSDATLNFSDGTHTVKDQEIRNPSSNPVTGAENENDNGDYIFGDRPGWGGGDDGLGADMDDLYLNYRLYERPNGIGTDSDEWLVGSDSDDLLLSKGGDDILVPGKGSDIVEGGKGNDVIVWLANDHGTTATPDTDIIINFGGSEIELDDQSDVLDISKLLPAGANNTNITDYLSITTTADQSTTGGGTKEGDTTINIDLDSSGPVLKIILQRWSIENWQVKYSDNSLSNTTLLNALIDNGQLKI